MYNDKSSNFIPKQLTAKKKTTHWSPKKNGVYNSPRPFDKDRDFFIKILDHKVRTDISLAEGHPIQIKKVQEIFQELNYSLNGA